MRWRAIFQTVFPGQARLRRRGRFPGAFLRDESGNPTLEFTIVFPAMVAMLLAGAELGMIGLRHSTLERALDLTVRDIRLGTGQLMQHDEVKAAICRRAPFIKDCNSSLRLEMIQLDPRSWSGIDARPDCIDQSRPVSPVRNFQNRAQPNDMMILRACAQITPVFPSTGLGRGVTKDGAGQFSLVAVSAFVQEPE